MTAAMPSTLTVPLRMPLSKHCPQTPPPHLKLTETEISVEVSLDTQQGMTGTVTQNIKYADFIHEATDLCQDVLFPH